MAHCPSHDWDRYSDEQELAAAEEVLFWRENKSGIVAVAGHLIASPAFQKATGEIGGVVRRAADLAGMLVKEIVSRGKDPYE